MRRTTIGDEILAARVSQNRRIQRREAARKRLIRLCEAVRPALENADSREAAMRSCEKVLLQRDGERAPIGHRLMWCGVGSLPVHASESRIHERGCGNNIGDQSWDAWGTLVELVYAPRKGEEFRIPVRVDDLVVDGKPCDPRALACFDTDVDRAANALIAIIDDFVAWVASDQKTSWRLPRTTSDSGWERTDAINAAIRASLSRDGQAAPEPVDSVDQQFRVPMTVAELAGLLGRSTNAVYKVLVKKIPAYKDGSGSWVVDAEAAAIHWEADSDALREAIANRAGVVNPG